MKPLLFSAALLVASAGFHSASLAAGSVKGINLGWSDCPNQGDYQLTRTFACDTNSGASHTLVGSFSAPQGMVAVTGYSAVISVQTSEPTLSPWWELRSFAPAGCRAGSMVHSTDFTGGPFNCFDYWQGGAIGGASAEYPTTAANRARLMSAAALPTGDSRIGPIAAGTEVYAFKLSINNAKTIGPGSCGGCGDEACIVLSSILVTQVPPEGNFYISNPATSAHVFWHGWSTIDPAYNCLGFSPTKDRTWGAIKAAYR